MVFLLVLMIILDFLFFLFGRIVVMILARGMSLVLIFVFSFLSVFSVHRLFVYSNIFILVGGVLLYIYLLLLSHHNLL